MAAIIRRHAEQEEREVFNALKKSHKGYWYYTVPTSTCRSGEYKISTKTYNKLKAKYGNTQNPQS